MMNNYKGKKLLILAGANVHVKLVEEAKELGVYTIVTDFLEPEHSPAKLIADEYWMLNVTDVDGIVERCRQEHVDGVIAGWIDVCQIPYCQICHDLNLPCYGSSDLFFKFTNKHAFKDTCKAYGVGTILEYTKKDALSGSIDYPVFVKPVDSRGSRGQSICNSSADLSHAIAFAEEESSNGDIIIEKYLADKNSFQVTYLFADGIPYVLRTADGYKGLVDDKLDKVALCSVSPSIYTDEYMRTTHPLVIEMMKREGLENGPFMLQGFYDDGTFRFYDPGLRFPGVDFDIIYRNLFGVSVMAMMVEFALTGKMLPEENLTNYNVFLKGGSAAVLFPTIAAGKLAVLEGMDAVGALESVHSVTLRHLVGDNVPWSYNVNQRLAEINVFSDNKEDLKKQIQNIYSLIDVRDEENRNMLYKPFDVNRID